MWKLLWGVLGGVAVAYILTWFNVDQIIIRGIYQLFKFTITREIYYLTFIILGFVVSLFTRD